MIDENNNNLVATAQSNIFYVLQVEPKETPPPPIIASPDVFFAGISLSAPSMRVCVSNGTIKGLNTMSLKEFMRDYRILKGYKIVLLPQSPTQLAEYINHGMIHNFKRITTTHNVVFEGEPVILKCQFQKEARVKITMVPSECLHWTIDAKKAYVEIHSLFFRTTSRACFPSTTKKSDSRANGRAAWMLRLIDEVHVDMKIKYSVLDDASTFSEHDSGIRCFARCLYALTHNGLSFYMSKHYLVAAMTINSQSVNMSKDDVIAAIVNKKMSITASIQQTNKTIREANDFWNAQGPLYPRDKPAKCTQELSTLCEDKVPFSVYMEPRLVRFYEFRDQLMLEKPSDPSQPARFVLELEKRNTN